MVKKRHKNSKFNIDKYKKISYFTVIFYDFFIFISLRIWKKMYFNSIKYYCLNSIKEQ